MEDENIELARGSKGRAAPRRQAPPPREVPLIEQDRRQREQYFRNPGDFKGPPLRAAKAGGLIRADGAAIRGKTRGKMT